MKEIYILEYMYNGHNYTETVTEYESVDEFREDTQECFSDYYEGEEPEGKIYTLFVDDYDEGYYCKEIFASYEDMIAYIEPEKETSRFWGIVKCNWKKCRK